MGHVRFLRFAQRVRAAAESATEKRESGTTDSVYRLHRMSERLGWNRADFSTPRQHGCQGVFFYTERKEEKDED